MDYKKYFTGYISSIIYILIILILNCFIKNLNLMYVLFSIIILNSGIHSIYDYKNQKNKINLLAIIGCTIAFIGLSILIFS